MISGDDIMTLKTVAGHDCKMMMDELADQEWRVEAPAAIDIKKSLVLSRTGEPTTLGKDQADLASAFNFSAREEGSHTLSFTLIDVSDPTSEKTLETMLLVVNAGPAPAPKSM